MRKNFSFEFKLSIMAIGAIALLCLTLQVYFQDYQKIGQEIESVNDIYSRASLLNQLVITTQQTEFSHQNYILRKNQNDLRDYYESSFKLPVLITKLETAYALRPTERTNVTLVTSLVTEKSRQMEEFLKSYEADSNVTVSSLLSEAGNNLNRRLSNVVSAMLSNESLHLEEEQNLHNIRSQLQVKLYLVGSVVVLAIIAICMSLIIREVRHNRKLAQQLEHNATHDFLTGLPNRAYFVQALKHTLARAKREDTLAALFFLDLNGFKAINDSFGHEIGDLVLMRVADKLRTTMRESDVLSRLGGDEFVVLATKINDKSEITLITSKIESAMRQMSLPFIKDQKLTTSIGYALIPTDGESAEDLISTADKQMYDHKKKSRSLA